MKGERLLSFEKTFTMHKNDVAVLPADFRSAVIGLGWDCEGSVDLDASVICLDKEKKRKDIIYFSKLKGSGVFH
jgi:stress response protein SCP2